MPPTVPSVSTLSQKSSPLPAARSTASDGKPTQKPPSGGDQRIAAGQFERACEVIADGNYTYALPLLHNCCNLDPGHLLYRETLRQAEKAKHDASARPKWLAWLLTLSTRLRLKAAVRTGNYRKALDLGERILTELPDDVSVPMEMARAAEGMNLFHLAIWLLEQARASSAQNSVLNRTLARLYDKQHDFTEATAMWQQVLKAHPGDAEAATQLRNLAARETMARGNFKERIRRSRKDGSS
jgi:tetratricopeptide (TPR) repeat protein